MREKDWLLLAGSFFGGTFVFHVFVMPAPLEGVFLLSEAGVLAQWVWEWYRYGWHAGEEVQG